MREKNGSRSGGGMVHGSTAERNRRDGWTRQDSRQGSGRRRSRSRSPIKSKLMALAMQPISSKGKGHERGQRDERDRPRRDSSRDRTDRGQGQQRRLRMDEMPAHEIPKRGNKLPSPISKPADEPRKKTHLDKVVKRAREERSNYWDKKILEVEDRDPDRWGHSGFKELYHQKDHHRRSSPGGSPLRRHVSRKSRSTSRSPPPRIHPHNRSPSPSRLRRMKHAVSRSRSISRSRSPAGRKPGISRKDPQRSFSPSVRSSGPSNQIKRRNLTSKRPKDNSTKSNLSSMKQSSTNKYSLKLKSSGGVKSRLGQRPNAALTRTSSVSSSDSSDSMSRSPSPTPKHNDSGSRVINNKGKLPRREAPLRKRSPSFTESSSTSSDEDVLQIHAKRKGGRSPSLSDSDSQTSSSSSGLSRARIAAARITRSSSSSSVTGSSSDDSDSDESIRTRPKPTLAAARKSGSALSKPPAKILKTKPVASKSTPLSKKKPDDQASAASSAAKKSTAAPNQPQSKKQNPAASAATSTGPDKSSGGQISTPGKKVPTSSNGASNSNVKVVEPVNLNAGKGDTNTAVTKVSGKKKQANESSKTSTTVSKPKGSKSASESGETESGSESSDSDSEPRMTLSERFAKLAQMSTDKREMAKPVLSVNEIDTKMRVVKDFRNPEAPKVYVTGQGVAQPEKQKPRPKTPDNFESEKRFNADDPRRRHFERMYQDEPAERPLDWSDPRARYKYYKDRGCFDERPITFDEYLKWEDWYHKYQEWLEHEGYYERGGAPPPGPSGRGNNGGPWQQQQLQYGPSGEGERMPHRGGPYGAGQRRGGGPPSLALSNRSHFGRPEGNEYLHASIGRRIDRTPGGSLVVNIRQGGGQGSVFAGGRGRRIGNLGLHRQR